MTRWIFGIILCGLLGPWTPAASGEEAETFEVAFEPQSPSIQLPARFQPGSKSVPLRAGAGGPAKGMDHRSGVIEVGASGARPRRFVIARTTAGEIYDLLMVDTNGDGAIEDETPIEARRASSGQTRWSIFKIVLKVDHGTPAKPHVVEHRFEGFVAVSSKDEKPGTFQYKSQGHLAGTITIDGAQHRVILADRNSDASYGPGDAWTIYPTMSNKVGDAQSFGKPVKLDARMLYLKLGTSGGGGAILTTNPDGKAAAPASGGVLGKEHPEDAALPRAETPLPFAPTIADAKTAALKLQGPVFISFESDISKDTRAMRALVFTAKGVVDAAKGLSSARVDVDLDKDTAAQWSVTEAPTGILLDPEGEEIARFTGYQSVPALREFLGYAHPWLLPSDDEPTLRGKPKSRHAKIVKKHLAYLKGNKNQGLMVDRIKDLGTRKNRGARDALMKFAASRKSKEYVSGAFFALAEIGGRIAIEFLSGPKALGSKDFLVAQQAALALAEAKDAAAIDAILAVLHKKGTKIEVVSACCIALAKSAPKDERVIKAVFEHSRHGKDTIRSGAAEALGYLASDEAVGRLTVLLQTDKNTRVRGAAATGMGHTRRPELIPVLRKAISADNAHTVRTAAHEAIQKLQKGDD